MISRISRTALCLFAGIWRMNWTFVIGTAPALRKMQPSRTNCCGRRPNSSAKRRNGAARGRILFGLLPPVRTGSKHNLQDAVHWLRRTSGQDEADDYNCLDSCCYNGIGVKKIRPRLTSVSARRQRLFADLGQPLFMVMAVIMPIIHFVIAVNVVV